MHTSELDPKDYKYIVEHPNKDFSPRKNNAIIEETIKEADKYHRTEGLVIEEALGERIEAVAAYSCYRFNRGTKSIKQYLGDKLYAKMVGERILEKVRVSQTADSFSNKFKKPILL